MPRIIFKCGYLKDAGVHLKNLVEYIATREGVEKIPASKRNRPATKKQKDLILDILAQFPDSSRLFEYEDYIKNPTVENASEFISTALDHNLDQLSHQEVYVNYIATRPHTEKRGMHGLFTDEDKPLILSKVAEEVSQHTGNVWIPVISLRREDAARLGYDAAPGWMALLRKQRNVFAEQMKIAPENLRWYAAFHNEGHHPHCHLVLYSVNPREGYVTKQAIEKMRSSLAGEIFKQDLIQIYSEQTSQRNLLAEQSRESLKAVVEGMKKGVCDSPAIEGLLASLAERLRHTSGKKQYGYLKAPVKAIVDRIIDELAKDEKVAIAYDKWHELRDEVLRTYKDKLPEHVPLSRQKEFKQIKNMIISKALNLMNGTLTFEGEVNIEPSFQEESPKEEYVDMLLAEAENPESMSILSGRENESNECLEGSSDGRASPADNAGWTGHSGKEPGKPYFSWNDKYIEARTFLYGEEGAEPDFDQAILLYKEEAEAGNALAMSDLGRIYSDGLGVEINSGASFMWYEKALSAFLEIEDEKEHRYVEYRIGKMHLSGLGTVQDYKEAAGWLQMAVTKNHKYAQYSLAGLYYRGQGVGQDYGTTFDLYRLSAKQGMPYADYELAKMYRDGIGTSRNPVNASIHFNKAFHGFKDLEEESHDDKLQYRLGQMLYTGTGTEKNIGTAVSYLEKSARLGNVNAGYLLCKIYLAEECGQGNVGKAIQWLEKAAEGGNAPAQYALGKLYRDGNHVEKDVHRAVSLFTGAAEQGDDYAAFALGKLYLTGEGVPKDMEACVKGLSVSVDLGNQYAQYQLAKLYLAGEDITKDVGKAVDLFTKSALQDNLYAQYQLGKLYLTGEEIPQDIETAVRWLKASAEQGNQYSAYQLGKLYLLGVNVEKDVGAAIRWLLISANDGNQYAQYSLGKLYIMGVDAPHDREEAVKWLTLSAGQGNIYAQFLLDHLDSFRGPSLFLAATRILHSLSRIFEEERRKLSGGQNIQEESKLRRKLRLKKIAQGHAQDEQEPRNITY